MTYYFKRLDFMLNLRNIQHEKRDVLKGRVLMMNNTQHLDSMSASWFWSGSIVPFTVTKF